MFDSCCTYVYRLEKTRPVLRKEMHDVLTTGNRQTCNLKDKSPKYVNIHTYSIRSWVK